MTVSNAPTSLLESVLAAQTTRQEIGVAVLKKAEDSLTQQGEAMVQVLEKIGAPPVNQLQPLLDVYA
jgi:hypothetical protein